MSWILEKTEVYVDDNSSQERFLVKELVEKLGSNGFKCRLEYPLYRVYAKSFVFEELKRLRRESDHHVVDIIFGDARRFKPFKIIVEVKGSEDRNVIYNGIGKVAIYSSYIGGDVKDAWLGLSHSAVMKLERYLRRIPIKILDITYMTLYVKGRPHDAIKYARQLLKAE